MFSRQFYKSSSFFDAADFIKQLANNSKIRSSDRWLGRSKGEEIDENCLLFSHHVHFFLCDFG